MSSQHPRPQKRIHHDELFCRFMPADALWTFAMACNVYLTFFRKYDAKQLRLLEWRYILLCYGIPFVPAFVYFFVRSDSRGKVYGSAVVSPSALSFIRLGAHVSLVVVLGKPRLGCLASHHLLRTCLACDLRDLRNLSIRWQGGT
jgi:hypothetical protein